MRGGRQWAVGEGCWSARIRRVACRSFLGQRSCRGGFSGKGERWERRDLHWRDLHDVAEEFIEGLFDDFTCDVCPRRGREDRAFRVVRRGT